MSGIRRYKARFPLILAAGLLALMMASCNGNQEKELNRRVTLRRSDKIPYGAKIAYQSLSWIFPDAEISSYSNDIQSLTMKEGKKALICINTSVSVTASELNKAMSFVGDGNQIFLSAAWISDTLLHTLGLRTAFQFNFSMGKTDSLTVGVYSPVNAAYKSFTYPGDSYDSYFTKMDSQYTTILGRDKKGRPNFVRISYKGGGAFYLHLAPLAFSNFFLLHKENMDYYANALSYMPSSVKLVYWDEYHRYMHDSGDNFSVFQYIFSGKAGTQGLAWGFWLLLLLFLLIYLFDSKRRQRRIPVIVPLRNTSLDFVQTIGRLYFQRRDNHNLAMKMVLHFQEQVRTRYHLTVAALDNELAGRLSYRTGYSKEELAWLVDYMYHLPTRAYVPDDELVQFHQRLEAFYKYT